MKKYVCTVCGYVYDEAAGIPSNSIPPGTKWEDIPEDWACPLCGATRSEFNEQAEEDISVSMKVDFQTAHDEDIHEMSFGELSALCSNLSKGCEKQYRPEEAGLFAQLAEYYSNRSSAPGPDELGTLGSLIKEDIKSFTSAKSVSADQSDRGALRALVWGEKVTTILSSLLTRYEKQKDTLLKNTNVYVCEICGFIYIGDEPPEICPVCKVPRIKIRKIEKEAI